MPRQPRPHIPGGTYYLLQIAATHRRLLQSPADVRILEQRLALALAATHTDLHAFCWLDRAMHLVVRSHEIPVSRFMQRFVSGAARQLQRQQPGEPERIFLRRFSSALIDAEAWLPELVRFVHQVPVLALLCDSPASYPYSSWAIYAAARRASWLNTRRVREILAARDEHGPTVEFMRKMPSVREIALFTAPGRGESRIIGNDAFIGSLPRRLHTPRTRLTLEQLIEQIAVMQNVSRAEILSRSRRHAVVLARVLIAWHAIERRVATLEQVAHRLGRDSSTLSKTIARARTQHPHLFRLDALHHLAPLG